MNAGADRRARGSQRGLRVGEELRHALAGIIQRGELRDPVLFGRAITVTEVRTSPDLRHATAFVTPLGGADAPEVIEALERAGAFLRSRLAEQVRLRYMPDLTFKWDSRFAAATGVDSLLASPPVRRDLDSDDEA